MALKYRERIVSRNSSVKSSVVFVSQGVQEHKQCCGKQFITAMLL
jgi:hypothetical protein